MQRVNSVAAQMASARLRVQTLKAVKIKFQTHRKNPAVSRKTWATVATTTPLNTSSTPNMAAAVASGMADAVEIRIVSIRRMIAKRLASSRPAKMFVIFRRFMDHAPAIIQCGITTAIEIRAPNLSTEDVSEMLIDSRRLKTVKRNVLSTTKFVSFSYLHHSIES